MNEELLQGLYNKFNLSQKVTYDQFRSDMQSPDIQKRFYDKFNLSKKGTFETFQSDLGYKPPVQQTVEAPTEEPAEAPGFFAGLARQAKTTFGPQKEKSQILTELQQAPVDYNEYVNKQKILYDQTKVAAPVRYDMFQSNPVPTEQDFNTLSLDQIKKKYGTSEIANRTKGLMGDENRFSISVGSLLDQVASVPKEQQASTFKNLVNDALRKVREQQVYRKGQLEYQMERETAGIPQTFGEAVSRGELGTYIGSAIGGAAGSSAVALTKPLVGGYELTKGEILDMANKAKAESLGQTENEFIVSGGKLDSNSAVEVGSMVSSALEYVGLGKIAAPLFKNLVKEGMKSAMKKGIVEVGKGAAAEFSTEFVQSVNEQVSSQMAAGKKPEEIVINWDDALESGIQGGIGGGGLTTVSTVTSGLANAIAKRRKIEQIDNDINRLTDTGSPEINQQIDNELNLITPTGDLTYDQEGQIGVPSAEQQGAAPVQEGPQPEGRGTETETGGVLQVSPETPGAQAEVTPEANIEAKKADIEKRRQDELKNTAEPQEATKVETYEAENINTGEKQLVQIRTTKNGKKEIFVQEEGIQEGTLVWRSLGDKYSEQVSNETLLGFVENPKLIKTQNEQEFLEEQKSIFKGKTVREKINAKYDAELAALTSQVTPEVTPQVEVTPKPSVAGVSPSIEAIESTVKALESLPENEIKLIDKNSFTVEGPRIDLRNKLKEVDKKPSVVVPSKIQFLPESFNLVHLAKNKEDFNSILIRGFDINKTDLDSPINGAYFSSEDWSTVGRFGRSKDNSIYTTIKNDGLLYFDSNVDFINYLKSKGLPTDGTKFTEEQINTLKNEGVKGILLREDFVSESRNELIVIDNSIIQDISSNQKEITKLPSSFNDNREIAELYQKAKQDGSNPELVKAVEDLLSGKPITPTTQPAGQVTTEDLEAEGLRELEQLEQPTPPQPTAEQPTVEQPKTEQPVTPQPEAPTTEQPANLNDFKRYFFNKDPKAFGGNLGTALGMSQVGWQKAYNKFAKTATPEEIRMLDALRGKEVAVQPQVEEQVTEEEVILIDKTALLNAGYTNEQIKLVEDNPDKFGQIDDKIVNLETNEVIKPTGKKKVQVRPKRRPKETFPKKTYADLEKAMFTPGVKLDELLRIVIGMNNDYSALAEQLLNIYKSNKTVRLAKFDTNRLSGRSESGAWGVYRSYNNTVAVFLNDIKEYWKNRAKVGKISPREVQPETESSVSRILLHEIVHAYTVRQINEAIPAARSRNAEIRALQAYLKHGDNQGIKDIITLYLSAREQIKDLEKKDTKEGVGSQILKEARGTKAYGLKNIKEFLTEAFTETDFQRLLNRLESPIAPKTTWQSFVDAVKKILRIATTGAKELSPVKAGSILESVLRVAPDIMITDQEARTGNITEEVDMSPAPQDPRTAALIKVAQGLINKGATRENVIDRVKQSIAGKFNIDVDAYAQDILAGIEIRREAVAGPFNAEQAAVDIMDTPYWTYLTGLTAESKEAAIEEKVQDIADFLRDKVTSKEQVTEFQKAWNAKNPDYKISNNDVNKAWQLIKEPTIDKETITISINDLIKKKWQARAKGQTQGIRETTETFRELITMIRDTMKNNPLSRVQERAILTKLKKVNLFTPGSLSKLKDFINKVIQDAEYAAKLNTASGLKRRLKNPPKSVPANIQDISKKLAQIDPTDDMLDEYIENGSKIIRSFLRPDAEMYSPVNIADVEVFIDNYYTNREKDIVASLLNATSKATEQAVDEFVNPTSPEDQQAALEKIIAEQKRVEVLNNLSDIANNLIFLLQDFEATTVEEKETVKILRKYKPENVEDIKSLVRFIRIADNIITNNDFSGAGVIESEIRAEVEARPTIDEVKKSNNNINRIGFINSIWLGMTGTLQNIYENLTKSARGAVALLDYLGLSKYEETSSRAKQAVNKVEKDIDQKIGELNKKHNTQLLNNENQIKFTILSELAKYVDDPTANINKIVANIEADIRDLLNSDKEYAKELASTIYGVLDDMYNQGILKGNRKVDPTYPDYQFKDGEVKSSAQVVEGYFERTAPAVHELWNYFTTNVFTDKLYEDSKKVNSKFFNGILTKYKNYIPTSFRKLGEGVSFEDAYRNETYKPQQNRRFKEASRSRRADATYSYIQSIKDAVNGYKEVVHDNSTMEAQFQFEAAIARPELREIMSGEYRDFLIKDYKSRTDRSRSTVNAHLEDAQLILDSLSRNIKNLMNITKLFSVRQIAQQFIPAYASLVTSLGTKFKYLHTSIPEEFNDVIKMVPLGEANLEEGILNLNNQFNMSDKAAYNSVIKALEKSQNATAKFAVNTLTPVIGKPDLNIRKRGWIAFYIKRLEELGVPIEEIDLKTEKNKQDEETRRLARQYATLMIGKAMAPSTKFSRAELWKQKGVMNALVNTYLPFGTFTINFKNRVISALDKISNNKEEGYVELLSATNEAIAFSAIQVLWAEFVVLPLASAVYSSLFGYEFGEEDEEEFLGWDPKQWSDFWTKVYLDVNPTAISFTENFWLDTANFAVWLKSDTDKDFQEWKEDREAKSIFRKQTYETQGYFGMAGDQLHDLFYASSNLYNSKEFDGKFRVANDLYKDTELEITEDIEKIARYDFLMNTLGTIAPGELKSVWRMIRQEEIKYQREKEKKSNK